MAQKICKISCSAATFLYILILLHHSVNCKPPPPDPATEDDKKGISFVVAQDKPQNFTRDLSSITGNFCNKNLYIESYISGNHLIGNTNVTIVYGGEQNVSHTVDGLPIVETICLPQCDKVKRLSFYVFTDAKDQMEINVIMEIVENTDSIKKSPAYCQSRYQSTTEKYSTQSSMISNKEIFIIFTVFGAIVVLLITYFKFRDEIDLKRRLMGIYSLVSNTESTNQVDENLNL